MPKLEKQLKIGATVKVTSGSHKGESGKVLSIQWDKKRVLVEKVNMLKRHTRPNAKNKGGGIIEKEGSIHLSNVLLLSAAEKGKSAKPAKAAKESVKESKEKAPAAKKALR